ncbi:iron-containing alcohol dehydrogenase, partial [Thermodesulfobacteriota bacterium]
MKLLRVDMAQQKVAIEDLPGEWETIGGSGLVAKIMNGEVSPESDPLGPENKLIVAAGPLAGTMAPHLGRISVGAKSPLTLGIKEANSGGTAAQKLDRLGFRAIVVEGAAEKGALLYLHVSKDAVEFLPADPLREMKVYPVVQALSEIHNPKAAIVSIGQAGERMYRSASVSFTDIFGDPSRNAARGGLGAVLGAKGLKAIVIDDDGTAPVTLHDTTRFRETVRSWVETLQHDIGCGLFSRFGTPLGVATMSNRGTMPAMNYHTGRHEDFRKLTGETIQRRLFESGGKMHGCMPGCVVQCSIIYPDADGDRLCSAYEYEAIAMLGTNLGITDHDAIARLKFLCDDLGIDLIETGSSLGVAASAGKMTMGDLESAVRLLEEIEQGTDFGRALGNGVVSTATALNISRIPAVKGQAIPGHDPRAVKGIGVTYATSPMGADHTAGLTYRMPLEKEGQVANSLRFQVQAATCDTMGYCINAIPGGKVSFYGFLSDLLNALYGLHLTEADIVEIGKQTLKDQHAFNQRAEFGKSTERSPYFMKTEVLAPTNEVFDVQDAEMDTFWQRLDSYSEAPKIWETRFPSLPPILFGNGVVQRLGDQVRRLNVTKALLIADPVMKGLGRTDQVLAVLNNSGIDSVVFDEVEPDPPVEEIEKAGKLYSDLGCDGVIALGGGSSMDAAKAVAVRVSHVEDLVRRRQ